MKKALIILAIVFSGMLMQGQVNDVDIALAIMGHKADSLDKIADSLGVQLIFDGEEKIYVTSGGSTKYFKILITTAYVLISPGKREANRNIISEIFIRYNHKQHQHFAQFKAAEIPLSSDIYKFEKKQGKNVSHIKISYK